MEKVVSRSGVVLSKEVRERYEEWYGTLERSLTRLGIETPILKRIKDPNEFIKSVEKVELGEEVPNDENVREGIREIRKRLNLIFLKKNAKDNLPERIQSKQDLIAIAKWMEKDFGVSISTAIMHEDEKWGTEGPFRITYINGTSFLESTVAILHEMNHVRNPSSRELMKGETESVFSAFYPDKGISTACQEYFDGRAVSSYTEALKSSDDAVVAHAALRLLELLAMPGPDFYSNRPSRKADLSREVYGEGLRRYIGLLTSVGKSKLEEFEEECERRHLVPGLDNGELVVASPKEIRMFKVDVERL
ncbi:MAG: hypothetical protein ABSD68_01305 [Candidatus Micrarchaeales archaeon]|jgi:hypothetical protein